ncbi:MAG TPA: DOMON-like domain-containing protein [Caulobacteraceae bacterium]|nr:DOMON-like domain-containing protein [Caulobacteraceae bacterium]
MLAHPDLPNQAVSSLTVDALRDGSLLTLTYRLSGRVDSLVLPPPAGGVRCDELWRTTCFEAFVRPGDGDAYLELNLSPSTAWAAYRFSGYRAGMADARTAPPAIAFEATPDGCILTATIDLPAGARALWRVALTAVIEEVSGAKSYWSLAHAPGRPDFHNAAGFTLELREHP